MQFKQVGWIGICFLVLLIFPSAGVSKPRPTHLTVIPFTALEGETQGWLSKGLADLFTQNFSQVDSFILLDRSQMQAHMNELELSGSGLIEKDQALRMGRVAKVDQVLYGNYKVEGRTLHLNVFLMEMDTQDIIKVSKASGKLKQMRRLTQQVALDLIEKKGVKLSAEERKKIRFVTTDSHQATEHFYTGMDLFDRGQYADAFGRFFAASKNDSAYREAHLWMGRALESQGQLREAALIYRKLFKKWSGSVEAHDAMMFAGLLAEQRLMDRKQAIEIYKTLSQKQPVTSHNIEAWFRLGGLLAKNNQTQQSYRALQHVNTFYKKYSLGKKYRKAGTRNSSYFTWHHASTLHWDADRQMIAMVPDLTKNLSRKKLPRLPEGTYLLDPKKPVLKFTGHKSTKSFFKDVRPHQGWEERYYAVAVPYGYEMSGVAMEVTGKVFRKGMSGGQSGDSFRIRVHPFPLPREITNSWLGTLYGQTTQFTTLRKEVTFHGDNRQIIVIEVGASNGKVKQWEIKGYVEKIKKPYTKKPPLTAKLKKNSEALHLSTIAFPDGKFTGSNRNNYFYMPKKELSMAMDRSGRIGLVTLSGALNDAESDLWYSQSKDGTLWAPPMKLPFNSSSGEYYPRLVSVEDGSLRLFWISRQRGRDWEIWTSRLPVKGEWAPPVRVPLEKHKPWKPMSQLLASKSKLGTWKDAFLKVVNKAKKIKYKNNTQSAVPDVLEYAVMQNRRGQWVLVYYSYVSNSLVVLKSSDLKQWEQVSEISTSGPVYGPSLVQDAKGVYRLALFSSKGRPQLYSSNEGRYWKQQFFKLRCACDQDSSKVHSLQLIPKPDGQLTLLLSDNVYGLQYAHFDPDVNSPQLDLVSRALMEPFAVAAVDQGKYLVALKQKQGVGIYQYKNFTTHSGNTGNGVIYTETDRDLSGNKWDRIFAHKRFILPDVTALALAPNGRVWWGIESGIMSLKGESFSVQDVSNGFFHNFITDIAACSNNHAWVSSRFHEYPEVGRVSVNSKMLRSFEPLRTQRVRIPQAQGAISVIKCAEASGGLLIGTTKGQFIHFKDNQVTTSQTFASGITALTERVRGNFTVGTEEGSIHQIGLEGPRSIGIFHGRVNDLTVDAKGSLWAAVDGKGLARFKNNKWKMFSPQNSSIAYDRIGMLIPASEKGIWYGADGQARSFGIGYFDGVSNTLYNPPQRFIDTPSALDIDRQGRVWVGTWYDGVYKLDRREP